MSHGRTYEELAPIDRTEVEAVLASGDVDRIGVALIRAALHHEDRVWLESLLGRSLTEANAVVRRAAAISAGHVGRIHRGIDHTTIVPLLVALESDPVMGGYATNALSDIAIFTRERRESSDRGATVAWLGDVLGRELRDVREICFDDGTEVGPICIVLVTDERAFQLSAEHHGKFLDVLPNADAPVLAADFEPERIRTRSKLDAPFRVEQIRYVSVMVGGAAEEAGVLFVDAHRVVRLGVWVHGEDPEVGDAALVGTKLVELLPHVDSASMRE